MIVFIPRTFLINTWFCTPAPHPLRVWQLDLRPNLQPEGLRGREKLGDGDLGLADGGGCSRVGVKCGYGETLGREGPGHCGRFQKSAPAGKRDALSLPSALCPAAPQKGTISVLLLLRLTSFTPGTPYPPHNRSLSSPSSQEILFLRNWLLGLPAPTTLPSCLSCLQVTSAKVCQSWRSVCGVCPGGRACVWRPVTLCVCPACLFVCLSV